MKLKYTAKAESGALKIQNRKGLVDDLRQLEGKVLTLTIERKRNSRSNQQNRYYWGCVVPIVKEGLIDMGWERDKIGSSDQVHELLKHLFCKKIDLINEVTGEVIEMPPTTTELTTTGMMDYIEDIQRWATEFLGIHIPDPGQQVEFNADGW